jgi:hypothetical protein
MASDLRAVRNFIESHIRTVVIVVAAFVNVGEIHALISELGGLHGIIASRPAGGVRAFDSSRSGFLRLVNLAAYRFERPQGDTSGPDGAPYETEVGQGRRSRQLVDPLVELVRFPIGVFGLWWGTRRYLRPGRRNERLGIVGLVIGFACLLLPW